MEYAEFIRNRITMLRLAKGVSEYQMSRDLGHSKSYIQGISSGRALPSMGEFLAVCDYFNITPEDFFRSERKNPALLQRLMDKAENLSDGNIELLLDIIDKFG